MSKRSLHAPVIRPLSGSTSVWDAAAEASIQASLPAIPQLEQTESLEGRVAVYQALAAAQRSAFKEAYGDPYGHERRAEDRDERGVATARQGHLAAHS